MEHGRALALAVLLVLAAWWAYGQWGGPSGPDGASGPGGEPGGEPGGPGVAAKFRAALGFGGAPQTDATIARIEAQQAQNLRRIESGGV